MMSWGSRPEPCHPMTITAEVVHGRVLATQGWTEWRRVSMAFERQQSAAASLTLSCPGLSAPGLSDTNAQYRRLPGHRLASEPIRNRTCHRGTEPWPDTTHIQQHPPPTPRRASEGAKVSGQADLWSPAMFGHVHTQCEAQGSWLEYGGMKEGRPTPDCCSSGFCVCVCMLLAWRPGQWLLDHRTFPETPSPPPDVQLLSQVSLLGARREELHRGWSRITGPACLSGWAYFCWLGLVLSSSQCRLHWADPFDVLIHWPPHRNNSHFVTSKSWRHCVGFGAKIICSTEDEITAVIRWRIQDQCVNK